MFCTKCGRQVDDDQIFCDGCGTRLLEEEEKAIAIKPVAEQKLDVEVKPVRETIEQAAVIEKVEPIKKQSVGKCVLIGFLVFVGFLFGLCWSQIHSVRQGINDNNIKRIVGAVNLNQIEYAEGMNLSEYIYDNISESNKRRYNLSEDDIDEILSDDDVRDFIANKMIEGVDFLVSDYRFSISAKEIMALVKSQSKSIEKITGYTIREKDLEDMEISLKEEMGKEISSDDLSSDITSVIKIVRPLISYVFISVIGIAAILLAGVVIWMKRPVSGGLKIVSITTIVLGILLIAERFMVEMFVPSAIKSSTGIPVKLGKEVLAGFLDSISTKGYIALGVGLIVLVGTIVTGKVMRKEKTENL